jgi:flagellar motility protein MotE (MotC chaperone)
MHILLKLLFFIVIPVILVGGFVFEEVYFNTLGIRDKTCDFFMDAAIWLDPDTASISSRLDRRSAELDRRSAELDKRTGEIDIRKTGLDDREREIASAEANSNKRSADLDKREQDLKTVQETHVPVYRRILTDQELEDMKSLSRTFSRMTPETAVDILTRLYDPNDVAAILYYMSERDAAAIMSAMTVEYAAKLTEIFLYE